MKINMGPPLSLELAAEFLCKGRDMASDFQGMNTMLEEEEQPAEVHHFVGKRDDLIKAKCSFKTLEGRDILVIHHEGCFYALDSYCYHAGGMLQDGDIEEINGKMCIICPKHKFKISLAEGEGLYRGKDPREKLSVPRWYSKGVKQRTHTVTESQGDVFVKLSQSPSWVESDYYQGEKGKIARAKAEATDKEKGIALYED